MSPNQARGLTSGMAACVGARDLTSELARDERVKIGTRPALRDKPEAAPRRADEPALAAACMRTGATAPLAWEAIAEAMVLDELDLWRLRLLHCLDPRADPTSNHLNRIFFPFQWSPKMARQGRAATKKPRPLIWSAI